MPERKVGKMHPFELDTEGIRDISPDALDENGRLKVQPAAFWAKTNREERALFGHRHAAYGLPTEELVTFLKGFIHGRPAIEIGAGNGVLAEALGIPATDNRQQEMPKYREIYARLGQPTVKYGPNVITMDAAEAVAHYRPAVVVGCWITHRYDPLKPWRQGNEIGVDEEEIIDQVEDYVSIGNGAIHSAKPIWTLRHLKVPDLHPYLYSRAMAVEEDFLAVWPGGKPSC